MQLPNEKIQSDQDFKAECKAHGLQAIRLLEWLQESYKKDAFAPTAKTSDREKCFHKFHNAGELIQTIRNELFADAPTLNI